MFVVFDMVGFLAFFDTKHLVESRCLELVILEDPENLAIVQQNHFAYAFLAGLFLVCWN